MTKEQKEKLKHAVNAPNRAYCDSADDPDMTALVESGHMRGPISAGFLGKGQAYFQATRKGISQGQ